MLETLDEKASLLKDRREDKKKKKEERRASEPGGCQTILFPSLIALRFITIHKDLLYQDQVSAELGNA